MAQHIAQMIQKGNPQAIEKYVKNHLPSDPASLQRIYKELVQYVPISQTKAQTKKLTKLHTKSHSVSSLPNHNKVIKNKEDQMPMEKKRTQKLIKMLKQKGFKTTNSDQQLGLAKFKAHKQRLTKPHIANSKLLKSQDALIDRLINRYTINTKYYNNQLQDIKIDLQNYVDPDMREFLQRRNSILQTFKNKTSDNATNFNKFSTVSCRVYERASSRISFQKMPSKKETAYTTVKISPTKRLMQSCADELKEQKYKKVRSNQNMFRQASLKIQKQFQDKDQGQQNVEEMINFKKKLSKIQFQRYTNTYMKMMNNKIKEGSKCKLSNYGKELLRDERRMRNIIDFSNK